MTFVVLDLLSVDGHRSTYKCACCGRQLSLRMTDFMVMVTPVVPLLIGTHRDLILLDRPRSVATATTSDSTQRDLVAASCVRDCDLLKGAR
jgi:hypothetical protein